MRTNACRRYSMGARGRDGSLRHQSINAGRGTPALRLARAACDHCQVVACHGPAIFSGGDLLAGTRRDLLSRSLIGQAFDVR
jgi:hypothetical protein